MKKLVLIFDYFKEAFHTNRQNKVLYKPQLALIGINVLMVLLVGIGIYSWIGVDNINNMVSMRPEEVLGFILGLGGKILALVLAYALISVVIESGLLNMYKKAVTVGSVESGDFKEGISKYFFKLLGGKILILLCYMLSFPFYLIFGLITLTVGLTLIPVIAGVFLTMWKVSLVMNDTGIFEAIKDSFGFAKRNFIPLTMLQVIHWSFTEGFSGGSGSSYNFNNTSNITQGLSEGALSAPDIPDLEIILGVIKTIVIIIIPIVAVATIAGSVVAMVFEVFFMLALFVAYKNSFQVIETPPVLEEATEVSEVKTVEILEEIQVDVEENKSGNEEVEQ